MENGGNYMPLANLSPGQGRVDIINSPLTEGGVLGFEYGYSIAHPLTLVLWEAQFGDFANVAQVYIDQFISSGEAKWQILSGLVMLLPHGLEGTGPEHASARLERFLSSAARDNYLVVCPTTPAQIFHLLRRQAKRTIRKPLIVMSPKSMLRHPSAVSDIQEFSTGAFQKIIVDKEVVPQNVEHVILCAGKIFYDIIAKRQTLDDRTTAVVRIEQLYPMLPESLLDALSIYPSDIPLTWVQEEPLNMGANPFMRLNYESHINQRFRFGSVGRPEAATPATGSAASHRIEQEMVLESAFRLKSS
jgi:2-oxoglutarate dehydrogenase E1 component